MPLFIVVNSFGEKFIFFSKLTTEQTEAFGSPLGKFWYTTLGITFNRSEINSNKFLIVIALPVTRFK